MRRLILEALEEQEERKLGRSISGRFQNALLTLFGEALERTKVNVYTPVFNVME